MGKGQRVRLVLSGSITQGLKRACSSDSVVYAPTYALCGCGRVHSACTAPTNVFGLLTILNTKKEKREPQPDAENAVRKRKKETYYSQRKIKQRELSTTVGYQPRSAKVTPTNRGLCAVSRRAWRLDYPLAWRGFWIQRGLLATSPGGLVASLRTMPTASTPVSGG